MTTNEVAKIVIRNNYEEKHSRMLKKDLAEKMGVSKTYLSNLFSIYSDVVVDFDVIDAYCKATGEKVISIIGKILEKMIQQ